MIEAKKIFQKFLNIYLLIFLFILLEIILYLNHFTLLNGDYAAYREPALQFLSTGKFSGQIFPIGYSLLIAGVYALGGGDAVVFAVNIVVLVASLFVFYYTLKKFANKSLLLSVLAISVFHPVFFMMPPYYLSECLFTFFLSFTVLFFLRGLREEKIFFLFIGVLFAGLSAEVRKAGLFIPLLLIIPYFTSYQNKKFLFQRIFLIVLYFVLVMIWEKYDSVNLKEYLRNSMIDGLSRYHSSASQEMLQNVTDDMNPLSGFLKGIFYTAIHQPLDFLLFSFKKLTACWYKTNTGEYNVHLLLLQSIFIAGFFTGLILVFLGKIKSIEIKFLIALIIYMNLTAYIVLSICRYIAPLTPIYIFTTLFLLVEFFQRNTKIKKI